MKKAEVFLIAIILIVPSLVLCGCEDLPEPEECKDCVAFIEAIELSNEALESSNEALERSIANTERVIEALDIWLGVTDPNYDSRSDPNHIDYYDPNDPWVFNVPENPAIYINEDTFRLHPGSSIKYVEIGDPCVVVSYIEPKATGMAIEFDVNDPNLYSGTLIFGCTFNMTDPNIDGSNWYCKQCQSPPAVSSSVDTTPELDFEAGDLNSITWETGTSFSILDCNFVPDEVVE